MTQRLEQEFWQRRSAPARRTSTRTQPRGRTAQYPQPGRRPSGRSRPRHPESPLGVVTAQPLMPWPAGPTPSQGSEYVRWVQSALNQVMDLRLPVSGRMGRATRSAIRRFQAQEGLHPDGIVGPDTERALMARRAVATPRTSGSAAGTTANQSPSVSQQLSSDQPSPEELAFLGLDPEGETAEGEVNRNTPDYVRWIQQSLNRLQGAQLAVDGLFGSLTRSAVIRFQQQRGLAADGIVGPLTEVALTAAGAGSPPGGSGTAYGPPAPSTTPPPPAGQPDIVAVRGIQVARQIAPKVEALMAAAQADGIILTGGGWRSRERQIELRRQHCGPTQYDIYERPSGECTPPTAPPGRSMHEQGLAIDFQHNGQSLGATSPAFRWLAQNASRFGFYNLPSEPWHWSVNGH
jgi:peptidoglycan hydrolase-like protein with peptidoglycan-binding domain